MFGLTPFNKRPVGLVRRNDIFDVRNIFEDFFSDSLFPTFATAAHPLRADIRETEKEYVVEAEIPGVKKEDLKIDLRNDVLTLSVEHHEEANEEKENYIRRERRSGSFSRSFYVENIKNEEVKAKYDNGILTVTLPKSEHNKEHKHRIDIQ